MQNDDTPGPAPVDPTIPRNVGGPTRGRDRPHIPATDFDPIAVGDKIAGHLAEADKADAAKREHSMAAGALLLDVQVNHPKHMNAICDRIGLRRSRRAELLMASADTMKVAQVAADAQSGPDSEPKPTSKRTKRNTSWRPARNKPRSCAPASNASSGVAQPDRARRWPTTRSGAVW